MLGYMIQHRVEMTVTFRVNEEPEVTLFAPTALTIRGDQLKLFICKYVLTKMQVRKMSMLQRRKNV